MKGRRGEKERREGDESRGEGRGERSGKEKGEGEERADGRRGEGRGERNGKERREKERAPRGEKEREGREGERTWRNQSDAPLTIGTKGAATAPSAAFDHNPRRLGAHRTQTAHVCCMGNGHSPKTLVVSAGRESTDAAPSVDAIYE